MCVYFVYTTLDCLYIVFYLFITYWQLAKKKKKKKKKAYYVALNSIICPVIHYVIIIYVNYMYTHMYFSMSHLYIMAFTWLLYVYIHCLHLVAPCILRSVLSCVVITQLAYYIVYNVLNSDYAAY